MYDLLPVKNLQGYFYKSHNLDEPNINPCITLKNVVVDGFLYSAVPLHSREGDAYSILKVGSHAPACVWCGQRGCVCVRVCL